jgi:hypothetical protein
MMPGPCVNGRMICVKTASRMYVNIGETNECDEIEVVFNMEGSTKAYNYLKDHPSQPTVIHYHK